MTAFDIARGYVINGARPTDYKKEKQHKPNKNLLLFLKVGFRWMKDLNMRKPNLNYLKYLYYSYSYN